MSQPKNYPKRIDFKNSGAAWDEADPGFDIPYEIPFEYKQIVLGSYSHGSSDCQYPGDEKDWSLFNEFAKDITSGMDTCPVHSEKFDEFREMVTEAIEEFVQGGALADIIADEAGEKFKQFKLKKKAEWHPPLIYPDC